MSYDNTITNGMCVGCKKHFKNNSRRINIALCLDDNKLYCKSCAIKKDTDGFFKSLTKLTPKPHRS